MVLGSCLKIRDVCMVFEAYFKVHSLVSVHPKSIILGEMTNLDMIFHVVVSVYQLVKIWNSPQFPDEFRNSQLDLFFGRGGYEWHRHQWVRDYNISKRDSFITESSCTYELTPEFFHSRSEEIPGDK